MAQGNGQFGDAQVADVRRGEARRGSARGKEKRRNGGRMLQVLALIAVATGVAAVTAAACALSYNSIHTLAGQAGLSAPLARIYPYVFDAVLVLAGCSVLALRGAGLPSRFYGWLSFLLLLAALAAGGAVHAAGLRVPHRFAAVIGAIVPFVLVLIAFGLLLALMRHARLRRMNLRAVSSTPLEPADALEVAADAEPGRSGPGNGQGTDRSPVIQPAEMQLRARIPRTGPAAADAGGTPATEGPADDPDRYGPLLPPVGSSAAAERLSNADRRTNPQLIKSATSAGQSDDLRQPPSQDEQGDPDATTPAADEEGEPHADQIAEASGQTGPEHAVPAEPPAFDRPRSSPTPPGT